MSMSESYPELLDELRASRERNLRLLDENEHLRATLAGVQQHNKVYHPQASVAEMMRAFGQEPRTVPQMIEDDTERGLCAKLVLEEALEFVEALGFVVSLDNSTITLHGELTPNLVEAVDAVGDILVVTYGAANRLGVQAYPVFEEVQRSNMSKVGPDGKVIRRPGDGKVLKPETFSPPDIEGELKRQGWLPFEGEASLQSDQHATPEPPSMDSELESAVRTSQQDLDSIPGEDTSGDGLRPESPTA